MRRSQVSLRNIVVKDFSSGFTSKCHCYRVRVEEVACCRYLFYDSVFVNVKPSSVSDVFGRAMTDQLSCDKDDGDWCDLHEKSMA